MFALPVSLPWCLIGIICIMDGFLMYGAGAALVWSGLMRAVIILGVLAGWRWLCLVLIKRGMRLATGYMLPEMAEFITKFLAAACAISCLQYAAAYYGRSMPVLDDELIRFDAALGFDWTAFHDIVVRHPLLHFILSQAYGWTLREVLGLILLTAFLKDKIRNMQFFWALTLSAAMCCLFSYFWPTTAFANTEGDAYFQMIAALRSGHWQQYDPINALSLVTFPSYHTVMAVLMMRMALVRKWLAAVLIPFNIAVVISTAPIGGHYLADILAGIAIAAGVMPLAAWLAHVEATGAAAAGRRDFTGRYSASS